MGLKKLLGYSAFLGNRRRLDELLGQKREYEYAIKHKQRDWEDCQRCMPSIDREIAEVRAKIVEEDAN